jgi:predicted RNA binding protein YcfA (HicA-like mRNA interferase family)
VPNPFPSLRAPQMLRVLSRLGYREERRAGSHRRLVCAGRRDLTFAFHDRASLPPGVVRSILVRQVGLTAEEALEVVGRG